MYQQETGQTDWQIQRRYKWFKCMCRILKSLLLTIITFEVKSPKLVNYNAYDIDVENNYCTHIIIVFVYV